MIKKTFSAIVYLFLSLFCIESLYAANGFDHCPMNGDKIDVSEVGRFEAGLLTNLRGKHSDLLEYITKEDPKIKGEAADKISSVLDEFSADFA